MMSAKATWFSVRLLYRCEIEGEPDGDYEVSREQSIRVLKGFTESEVLTKARNLGLANEVTYQNEGGEKVHWKFVKVLEIQDLAELHLEEGMEVYSRIYGQFEELVLEEE